MAFDAKDRRLLYELEKDARASVTKLAKRLRLGKNVVSYRIQKLEREGIITGYYPLVDASRLGYCSMRVYITLQNTTLEVEEELLQFFVRNAKTWWVARTEPLFDIAVILWVQHVKEFYTFWEKTLTKYGKYFQKTAHAVYVEAVHYSHEYVAGKNAKNDVPVVLGANEQVEVSNKEKKFLQALATNARMPITQLAKVLRITPRAAIHRMKILRAKNILLGCRTSLDTHKLGFENYRLNLYLNNHAIKQHLEVFLSQNPSLTYINRTVGGADVECEFHLASTEILREMIDALKKKFDGIQRIEHFVFKKVYKEQFMLKE